MSNTQKIEAIKIESDNIFGKLNFNVMGMEFAHLYAICRAMKEEANNLIMHYYGVNGWTEFYEVGFDGAAWDNIDLKFIELFVKVEKACEEALL